MNRSRHAILGLFFFVVLFILGFLTIYLGDFSGFGTTRPLSVLFANIEGIRVGDPVTIFGVEAGRVTEVVFTGKEPKNERIRLNLTLERELKVREDYQIGITQQSLLGGKRVEIDPGTGPRLAAGTTLFGTATGGALNSIEEFLQENRQDMRRILDNMADITESVSTGERSLLTYLLDDQAYDDLTTTVSSARAIATRIERGEGSIGQLVMQDEAHEQLLSFLGNGGDLFEDLTQGQGSIARFIREDKFYNSLTAATDSARDVFDRVRAGQGVLGKLTSDESDPLFRDAERILANWNSISENIVNGEGALGKLINDKQTATELAQITENLAGLTTDLAVMVDDLQHGRGVLGYLLADDEARQELEHIVAMVSGALEDAREAAPVSSFASFLFGQL